MPRGPAWTALVRFNDIVYRLFEVLCAAATSVVVVAVIYQVISRYFGFQFRIVFGGAPWSEEGAIFSFIWAVVLGNALGVRDHSHLVADILPETLGPMGDKLIASLTHIVDLTLGVVFLVWGYKYADQAWVRYSDVLGYPMFYMFVSLPITAVGILTFTTERLILTWARRA
jgi:TRAP-type C4-dicarboxylate transport system permease small subunit